VEKNEIRIFTASIYLFPLAASHEHTNEGVVSPHSHRDQNENKINTKWKNKDT